MFQTCKCSIFDFDDFGENSVLYYSCLQKLSKLAKYEKDIIQIKQIATFLHRFISAPARKRAQPTKVHATELHTPLCKKSKRSQPR